MLLSVLIRVRLWQFCIYILSSLWSRVESLWCAKSLGFFEHPALNNPLSPF